MCPDSYASEESFSKHALETLANAGRRTDRHMNVSFRRFSRILTAILVLLSLGFSASSLHAQDWVRTGSGLGNQRIRLGAADFKPVGNDPQTPQLKTIFDATLFADLSNAG